MPNRLSERFRRRGSAFALESLRRLYGKRPVPVATLRAIHELANGGNESLVRAWNPDPPDGDAWSLHPETMKFLEIELERRPASHILEFGSGRSTSWLARVMLRLHPASENPRVFAIEQDERFATEVENRLDQEGHAGIVRVLTAPLMEQEIWGRRTRCYDLQKTILSNLLGTARPDVVVIDGPAGEAGIRFGTLPSVIDHIAPDALFFLDDALRRTELDIAAEWDRFPRIHVDGVHLVGRGLISGQIRP